MKKSSSNSNGVSKDGISKKKRKTVKEKRLANELDLGGIPIKSGAKVTDIESMGLGFYDIEIAGVRKICLENLKI